MSFIFGWGDCLSVFCSTNTCRWTFDIMYSCMCFGFGYLKCYDSVDVFIQVCILFCQSFFPRVWCTKYLSLTFFVIWDFYMYQFSRSVPFLRTCSRAANNFASCNQRDLVQQLGRYLELHSTSFHNQGDCQICLSNREKIWLFSQNFLQNQEKLGTRDVVTRLWVPDF